MATPTADPRQLQPEQVLEPDYVAKYEAWRDAVVKCFMELRMRLVALRRLEAFPFDVLDNEPHPYFWQITHHSIAEACIVRFFQLTLDNGADTSLSNLVRLRNFVMEKALRRDFVPLVARALGEVDFDKRAADTLDKIETLRNKVVAHRIGLDPATDGDARVNVDELTGVETALLELFGVLCFGFGHGTLPFGYAGRVDGMSVDAEPDVDRVLLMVARSSVFLNAPEKEPGFWGVLKEKWLEEGEPGQRKLAIINEWREKLDLRPV